jgi:hypothetical protein
MRVAHLPQRDGINQIDVPRNCSGHIPAAMPCRQSSSYQYIYAAVKKGQIIFVEFRSGMG